MLSIGTVCHHTGHFQSYSVPCAVPFTPVTYLFLNWKLVPLDLLTYFTHLPTPVPLATTSLSSVLIYVILKVKSQEIRSLDNYLKVVCEKNPARE